MKALSALLISIVLPVAVVAQLSTWASVQSDRAVRVEPNDFWYWHRITSGTADVDPAARVVYDPSHTYFWWMTDNYMNLPRAWGIVRCGNVEDPPVVAFADTRLLTSHWDMGNIAVNIAEANGIPGVDDDGNGLIDDISQPAVYGKTGEVTSRFNGELPEITGSTDQHGTNMASLAVATTNNDGWWVGKPASEYLPMLDSVHAGVPGITWNAPYLPVDNVISATSNDGAFDYICGLKNAGMNIRVLNCSWTGETQEMVDELTACGILVVTGSGNDDWEVQPGVYSEPILTATAIDKSYHRCLFVPDGTSYYCGANYRPASVSNNVDVCGYASKGGAIFSWNADPAQWGFSGVSSAWSQTMTMCCGWVYDTGAQKYYVDMPMSIPGNGGVSPHSSPSFPVVVPVLTQTDMRTSGTSAQAAGVAALLFALYPQIIPEQAIGMIRRGCVSVDLLNQDQCCGSSLWSDCHYKDGENYVMVQDSPCDGLLGAGKLDAYRTLTLWGLIDRDTTLCGDVYVSGDVVIAGATVTVMPGTRFHIAPDDITYLDPWEPEARYDMSNARGDGKGYFEEFPTAPYDKIEIVMYDDSARLLFLSTPEHPAVFSSFVNDDGTDSDWIGINDRDVSVIQQPNGAGSFVLENAELGVF